MTAAFQKVCRHSYKFYKQHDNHDEFHCTHCGDSIMLSTENIGPETRKSIRLMKGDEPNAN